MTRAGALARMRGALAVAVAGLPTTAALHRRLIDAPDVIAGTVHTGWLEAWLLAIGPSDPIQ